jgi:hypothetical protein
VSKTLRAVAVVMVTACSSGGGRTRPPHPTGGDTQGKGEVVPGPAAPSERECDELIAHAVAIRIAELPPEQTPSEAEQTALRGELHAAFLAPCRAGSREGYACGMAAKTLAELEGCHATRNSSTSNSSVAPGGMAPPAPRSP